jgi:Tfp pilus assembly protein PilO
MQFPVIKDIIKQSNIEKYSKYLALMPDLKQENTKKFTAIVLTLSASIILGLFAINPTFSTVANLQKQISDNQFVDQQLQTKINNLSALRQKYTGLQNDLPVVYEAIPQSPEIPPLVAQVQTIAQNSNFKLNNFQTFTVDLSKQPTTAQKYSTFDFGFSGQGSYTDMTNFLDKLTNFQRIITIDNLSISRVSTNDNQSALQLSVKGTALFKE